MLPGTKHARNPSVSVNLRDVGAGAGHKANLREGVMFRASQILRRARLALTFAFQLCICHSDRQLCSAHTGRLLVAAPNSPSATTGRGLQRSERLFDSAARISHGSQVTGCALSTLLTCMPSAVTRMPAALQRGRDAAVRRAHHPGLAAHGPPVQAGRGEQARGPPAPHRHRAEQGPAPPVTRGGTDSTSACLQCPCASWGHNGILLRRCAAAS